MNDELNVFREHLERYRAVTLQALDFVSDEQLKWRPAADRRSIREELLHIDGVERFYFAGLLRGHWDEVPPSYAYAVTREQIRAHVSRGREESLALLAGVDAERMGEIVSVPGIPVRWPLRSWLWYVVEHEVHHKAVIATHLRSLGIEPPFFAFVMPRGFRPDRRPPLSTTSEGA